MPVNKPILSIIIPTKNEAANIPRLLKSLLVPEAIEVLIVDNHSTDKTRTIAKKILSKQRTSTLYPLPSTLLIKGPERSAQKNAGAERARGSHLLFLDADMEMNPELLKELTTLVRRNVTAAIIPEHSVGHDFWGRAVALERGCYQGVVMLEAPRLIRKTLFLKVGGYDIKLHAGEDWDLSARLARHSGAFSRTENPVLHHEPKGLVPNLERKWYYALHIDRYRTKHPEAFAEQASLTNRLKVFLRCRSRLMRHPLLTAAFLAMKVITFARWKLHEIHP